MTEPVVIATIARERGITGVHTHINQLRAYLARAGEPVELLTPHTWANGAPWRSAVLLPLFGARVVLERVAGPVNVWWYRTAHGFFLRQVLRRRLAQEGPCVVYAQCPVSAEAALAARRGPEQRVVLAVHFRISQADEWADKGQIARDGRVFRWIRALERAVLPAVDGLVFVSAWGLDAVREWMPEVDAARTTVVHNFVSAPEPAPPATPLGDLVSTGNLEAVKNHQYLLRVLAVATRLGHPYGLDIFGEGVEKGRLTALAEELGVDGQVRLHGFCDDVRDRLPGYAAYVHASVSESLPLAIIEAMAAGLPVVAARAGGVAELFDDPEQGRFWEVDDPERGARILIDLMESPDERRRAGRAARERFVREYDADVVVPRLLAFLGHGGGKVLGPGGGAATAGSREL